MRRRAAALLILLGALAACGLALYSTGVLGGPSIEQEAERLAALLGIERGMTVAEIGAGRGELTVEMARRVGPDGRVYSTELDRNRLEDIREAVREAGLANVTVVKAGELETNLPPGCCEAIFMRSVYHHVTNPRAFNESVRQSLKNGGLLAVIDFEPGAFWHLRGRPAGTPAERRGHGVERDALVSEVSAAGFEYVRTVDGWSGRLYLALFRATR